MQDLSDEDLLARFQEAKLGGGSGAEWINELFGRYQSKVALWCFRFTGDRESAGDLAQETFLKVYRNLDSFRGSAKFSTWLFTVTRNHCMSQLKSGLNRVETSAEELDFDVEDRSAANALEAMEQNQAQRLMMSLIHEQLDPVEKKVMVMHFANGMGLDAVSRLLGLTNASGARAHIVSAKRKLARAVERWKAKGIV
jgi:RNA polymerase sigma-70 factor (ECF subfamily)